MTTAFDALMTTLSNDVTLAAAIAGGLYDGRSVRSISRQETPDAYDEWMELRPCGLVRRESATPWGPMERSGRLYVTIWLYERAQTANIDTARDRIYALLHRLQLSATAGIYQVDHANDLLDVEQQDIGAMCHMSRYVMTIQR